MRENEKKEKREEVSRDLITLVASLPKSYNFPERSEKSPNANDSGKNQSFPRAPITTGIKKKREKTNRGDK